VGRYQSRLVQTTLIIMLATFRSRGLSGGPVNWREREADAAATLRDCRQVLADRGRTILDEVTGGEVDIAAWRRFPEGEVYDPASHAQYFYHCHAVPPERDLPRDEHGHFHLFLRAEGMPTGITPLLLPELVIANAPLPPQSAPVNRGCREEVVHLVAIAIDQRGEPIRLFTTNRWVTGETWYQADDVIRMLDRFQVVAAGPSAVLNRWLGAMVALFKPEITVLLRNRDKTVTDWRWRRRTNVFEDPRLEITSSFDIDLDARLGAVEGHTFEPASRTGARDRPVLPPMAEGWGV
jgi:hypothetical protein